MTMLSYDLPSNSEKFSWIPSNGLKTTKWTEVLYGTAIITLPQNTNCGDGYNWDKEEASLDHNWYTRISQEQNL